MSKGGGLDSPPANKLPLSISGPNDLSQILGTRGTIQEFEELMSSSSRVRQGTSTLSSNEGSKTDIYGGGDKILLKICRKDHLFYEVTVDDSNAKISFRHMPEVQSSSRRLTPPRELAIPETPLSTGSGSHTVEYRNQIDPNRPTPLSVKCFA
ncbi:hypothetical protein RB195_003353 [Necator americanus]|uniref:Uncharacterized protein n=1 Tax=Necator americanus TaxID=51031 RepID=A0ABR1DN55_NECAM